MVSWKILCGLSCYGSSFCYSEELWKLINIWLSNGQQEGGTDIWLHFLNYLSAYFTRRVPQGSAATFEMVWCILSGFSCKYSSFYNSERILKFGQHLTKLQQSCARVMAVESRVESRVTHAESRVESRVCFFQGPSPKSSRESSVSSPESSHESSVLNPSLRESLPKFLESL